MGFCPAVFHSSIFIKGSQRGISEVVLAGSGVGDVLRPVLVLSLDLALQLHPGSRPQFPFPCASAARCAHRDGRLRQDHRSGTVRQEPRLLGRRHPGLPAHARRVPSGWPGSDRVRGQHEGRQQARGGGGSAGDLLPRCRQVGAVGVGSLGGGEAAWLERDPTRSRGVPCPHREAVWRRPAGCLLTQCHPGCRAAHCHPLLPGPRSQAPPPLPPVPPSGPLVR